MAKFTIKLSGMNQYFYLILVCLAGAFMPFAFAPHQYDFLSIMFPALFLLSILEASPKQALLRGLFFGLGFFGVGVWWVYISIHIYGHATPLSATILTILLIFYMSLYPMAQAYSLQRWVKSPAAKILLAFPASWVLFEWLRSYVLTGFPWLLIGYTQMEWPLSGYAMIGGIWLVSLTLVFTSATLVALWILPGRWKITALMITVGLWLGGFLLNTYAWLPDKKQSLTVSLIQGNIPQELKWQPEMIQPIIDSYLGMTQKLWKSDLIIWPEGAVTTGNHRVKELLQRLDKMGKDHHSTVMLGIPIVEGQQYYNGMVAVGRFNGSYKKRRLVPFGEYLFLQPLSELVMDHLQIPMSNFSAGEAKQPLLMFENSPIATYICYETVYPDLVRSNLPDAQLLVAMTDDSWFGDSSAAEQHLEMMQMRALETRRYLLSVTNTGVSAVISPTGAIIANSPKFQRDIITLPVTFETSVTLWSRVGEWPVILLILSMLGLAGYFSRKTLASR